MRVRVLTIADLHQSSRLFAQVLDAVQKHCPDVLAFVGDFLFALEDKTGLINAEDLAAQIAKLETEHIVFVRGNHEEANWSNFAYSWPHEKRPLNALYGTALEAGPLTILGFPCHTGWEEPWCDLIPKAGHVVTLDPAGSGIRPLPVDVEKWLPKTMRKLGPKGR